MRDYAESRSEAAFAGLVRRHVDLVYSAALRMVCDSHQAQDVTQGVFVALAQNARQLTHHPVLSGWLHRTTQNLAANAVRTNVRRQTREQEAAAMNELLSAGSESPWEHIAPHLDAALGELSEPDRDAVLLRYFEKKSAQEIARRLGISDEAAQKRVSRAVERLREMFLKRGMTIGASGLAIVISANAVQAAPAGLAVTLCATAALAGTTIATTVTAAATKAITMTTLQKTIIGATLVAAIGTVIFEARHASQLREQNESLQRQLAQLQTDNANLSKRSESARNFPKPRRPAPVMQTTTSSAASPVENFSSANLLARVTQKPLRLSGEQAEKFLDDNHRNASSLLAAYRTTTNSVYLEEAMQKFPDDPQVAFEAVLRKGASPEEKHRWIDALKKSDPDNPLGNYLSALEHFNSGQTDHAVEELVAASGKSRFDDYFLRSLQANEEAYRAAGYSEVETRVGAAMGPAVTFPQLPSFKELSFKMVELAKSYRQAGDETSAQAALELTVRMGEHFDGSNGNSGKPPLFRAFGLAMEANALEAMNPASAFGSNGQTVQGRLDQIRREKSAITDLCQQLDVLYPRATPQDMINFLDRARLFGDRAAMEWLKQKYGGR